MLIGKDFDKVEFQLFGFHLVEPNALIGDTLLFLFSIYLAFKVLRLPVKTPFTTTWKWFFIIFGFSFLAGGFGHSFYKYWGIVGKFPSWYLGFLATFLIEWAMVNIHPNQRFVKLLNPIIVIKFLVAILAEFFILTYYDFHSDPSKGLIIPLVYTTVGLLYALGYLSLKYEKSHSTSFRHLWISVLILIPSTVFQAFKINFHPLFDRNDVAHILLVFSLICYYKSVKGYSETFEKITVIS